MNIQYHHARDYEIVIAPSHMEELYNFFGVDAKISQVAPKGGKTVALEVIPVWFFDTLEVGTFFEKQVGVARCSKDDNYNKKTGRELAKARMKNKRLTVVAKEGYGDHAVIVLKDNDDNQYALTKQAGYSKIHFVEYYG